MRGASSVEVVVDLIMDMHWLGHPSYAHLNEAAVRERAKALPEEGIPPEILKVLPQVDGAHDKLQPQKAATPCDGMSAPEEAGEIFALQRGRAVVAEGQSRQCASEVVSVALHDLHTQLKPNGDNKDEPGVQTLEVRTGNKLLDQFQPYYFSNAFPFCFKYGTACPDIENVVHQKEGEASNKPLPRRKKGAPRVSIQEWAACMARRVESQFRRDWTFSFTVWNFLFRTMVNLQRNAYIFAVPDAKAKGKRRMLSNEEIAAGTKELYKHLHKGSYIDINGERKPVKGDPLKLQYVPELSDAARVVLKNVEARTSNISGTHGTRKTMRHQTHANRVCHGTSIFITFSPSERDTTLMLRLTRARRSDPAIVQDGSGPFQSRSQPALDVDYADDCFRLSPEALAEDKGEGNEQPKYIAENRKNKQSKQEQNL